MTAVKTLTMNDLDQMVKDLVLKLQEGSWGSAIVVEDLPKRIEPGALEKILNRANRFAFELIAESIGITYLRNHDSVIEHDAATAIALKTRGLENTLPEPLDDEW